jgi:L-asparagine oxygenase
MRTVPTRPVDVVLSERVSGELERTAGEIGLSVPPSEIAARLAVALDFETHNVLLRFRHANDTGALLFHGVGPGVVPESAASYLDLPTASALLMGLAALVAIPAYATDEWDGAPVTDVKVVAGLKETLSSKGGRELPLHQETQHLGHPPDGLALLTVRGGSPTRVAASLDVVEHLADRTREALHERQFVHRLPASFGGGGMTAPTSVLTGPENMPEFKVDLATTEATNEQGRRALRELAQAVNDVALDIQLAPGDLLMLDNRRWLHGRGIPNQDISSRWLMRTLLVCDSWRIQRAAAQRSEHGLMVVA